MTFRRSHDGLPMPRDALRTIGIPIRCATTLRGRFGFFVRARAPVESRMQSTRVRRSSKQEEYGRVVEKRLFERWIKY